MVRPWRSGFVAALLLAASAHAAPGAGDPAPDRVGRTVDGEPISLAAHAGKVVVLSFWASWCGPSRKELPILEGIQTVAGPERVRVIAVDVEDQAMFRTVAKAVGELHRTLASDFGNEAQRADGVKRIPHTVIVDKGGRIVRVHRGDSEAGVEAVVADLNRALAE
jgi:thiol-disulfide isomerase/thioredoxin